MEGQHPTNLQRACNICPPISVDGTDNGVVGNAECFVDRRVTGVAQRVVELSAHALRRVWITEQDGAERNVVRAARDQLERIAPG
jgi:hypothetical protein